MGMERLRNEVVGARLECRDRIFGIRARGQNNDVSIARRGTLPDLPADVKSAATRHHPVEQRQPRTVLGLQMFPGVLSVAGDHRLVAPLQKQGLENPLRGQVVFRDQNLHIHPSRSSVFLNHASSSTARRNSSARSSNLSSLTAPSNWAASAFNPAANAVADEPFSCFNCKRAPATSDASSRSLSWANCTGASSGKPFGATPAGSRSPIIRRRKSSASNDAPEVSGSHLASISASRLSS